jgi:hypothetical protein
MENMTIMGSNKTMENVLNPGESMEDGEVEAKWRGEVVFILPFRTSSLHNK